MDRAMCRCTFIKNLLLCIILNTVSLHRNVLFSRKNTISRLSVTAVYKFSLLFIISISIIISITGCFQVWPGRDSCCSVVSFFLQGAFLSPSIPIGWLGKERPNLCTDLRIGCARVLDADSSCAQQPHNNHKYSIRQITTDKLSKAICNISPIFLMYKEVYHWQF